MFNFLKRKQKTENPKENTIPESDIPKENTIPESDNPEPKPKPKSVK